MLSSFNPSCPSVTSALGARLQSTPLTSKAIEAHLLLMPSTSSFAFNQNHSIIRSICTTSAPLQSRQEARIRREQRARVEQLGQQVFWVLDPSGVELMAFMYKQSGMVYILELDRQDLTDAFDGATLTQVLRRSDQLPRPPQALELTDAQVELPRSLAEFTGFDQGLHERRRYGYSDVWQHFVTARALPAAASQASLFPQSSSTILGDSPIASQDASHAPGIPSALDARLWWYSAEFREPRWRALLPAACCSILFHAGTLHVPSASWHRPPRRNHLGAHRPRHLVATSSQRCRWQARSHQRL